MNKAMYTAVEPLIVAVNPFQDLRNGTPEVIAAYRDAADCEKLQPHIFQISRRAVDNLHGVKKSQTIVVSGESGAGKTETTKQLMKYFASARSGNLDTRIQQAIMAANPVLEVCHTANMCPTLERRMLLQALPSQQLLASAFRRDGMP